MRILVITQWFAPEPEFKALPFARELQADGHDVQVLTGFPNYPSGVLYPGYQLKFLQREVKDGISVIRVPLYPDHGQSALKRILNYASFGLSAAIVGPFVVERPDVIYVYHPPPTVALAALTIGKLRGIPFVYDVQDLWPDTLAATGMLRNPALLQVVEWWCQYVYRHATHIVVLSKGFRERLIMRGIEPSKVEVIPNWCDESQTLARVVDPSETADFEGRFNILFAGNMGKAQALESVLAAAKELLRIAPSVHFVFVGGGVQVDELKGTAQAQGLVNVTFLPWRPAVEVGVLLQKADALLVHLKRDPLFEVTIPSKVQAYLAIGRPILIGVSGDASDLVEEAGAGLAFAPEDPDSLVKAVQSLLALAGDEREEMGRRGRAYYREHLSLAVGTRSFLKIFKRLCRVPRNP